jgi:hypothetical protein
MLPRPRPNRFLLLRLLALTWLACAVLTEPLASALGELHAVGHAEVSNHLHAAGSAPDHHDADDSDLLHALMHGGHCHGHCAAILPTLPLAAAPAGSQWLPWPTVAGFREHRLSTLLRPPIPG